MNSKLSYDTEEPFKCKNDRMICKGEDYRSVFLRDKNKIKSDVIYSWMHESHPMAGRQLGGISGNSVSSD